ncbi:peptide chain release factor N(5)-glutamine methyltransferase [candidate division KSB1 bacterium]|nr:peptide chain release factor N(5)-glutamine methyltransferase [candidate division KSB1 bacterium]
MTDQPRKLLDILNLCTQYLSDHQIENARLNAELILGHVLHFPRVQLYVNFEKPLSDDELQRIREALRRRAAHEPIQYILGETEFYGLPFKLNSKTLIPRPETELLVEQTCTLVSPDVSATILDVGTGSGIIAISLAKELPNSNFVAIDINPDSLELSEANARLNGVHARINFKQIDILSDQADTLQPAFDVIVSNPPYITTEDMRILPPEIKNHEPESALHGGEDGLRFYQRLAELSQHLLKSDGYVCVEIGYKMADSIRRIFTSSGLTIIATYADLNKIERVIIAQRIDKRG